MQDKLNQFQKKMSYYQIEGFYGLELVDALLPDLVEFAKAYKMDLGIMAKFFNVPENQLKRVLRKEPIFRILSEGIVWG